MKLSEAAKLNPGDRINCRLDCSTVMKQWWKGTVIRNRGYNDYGKVFILVDRDGHFDWNIEVTIDNCNNIEIPEWDDKENIDKKQPALAIEDDDTEWDDDYDEDDDEDVW